MTNTTREEIESLLMEANTELTFADKLTSFDIQLPPSTIFNIIAQIQLALRHPENKGPAAKIAESIARQLQSKFLKQSATHRILELGWNKELDYRFTRHPSDENPGYETVTDGGDSLVAEDITDQIPREKYEQMVALSKAIEQSILGTLSELDPDNQWEVVNLGKIEDEERQES